MNKLHKLLLALSCLFYTGCTYSTYDANLHSQRIRTHPHNNLVEVYFGSDYARMPRNLLEVNEMYLKLHPLVSGSMVEDTLMNLARLKGYDVILVTGKNGKSWEPPINAAWNEVEELSFILERDQHGLYGDYDRVLEKFSFKAYKKLDNPEFADQIVKYTELWSADSNGMAEKQIYREYRLPSGEISRVSGNAQAHKELEKFTDDYLLWYTSAGWKYKWLTPTTCIRKNHHHKIRVALRKINGREIPMDIHLKEAGKGPDMYNIIYLYNAEGKVRSKEVLKKGFPVATFAYRYDSAGRLEEQTINFQESGINYLRRFSYYGLELLQETVNEQHPNVSDDE